VLNVSAFGCRGLEVGFLSSKVPGIYWATNGRWQIKADALTSPRLLLSMHELDILNN